MPSPEVNTTWFLDDTSLLDELKRSQTHRARTPSIPGYDDMREIARGGQGVVYAATQRSTRRKIAIKVLLDGAFSSNAARRRFEREIDLVASLRHPNIVQVYDSGTTAPPDERLYFVMEFIDGVPLTEFTHDKCVRDNLRLFAEICDAVNFAHQRGVIHRDLKPSNIRVDSSGRPHVLDFGLAKSPGAAAREAALTMSVSGQFVGSLPWASPEQAEGATDRIDMRSDVYALGVAFYQALTGRFPYDVEASFREVLDNILTDEPIRPSNFNPDVDDEVETILLQCLAKDPARRYQTAGDLARDIRNYLAGEPIDAKRDSMWYTMRKRLVRYRLITGAAALLLLALIGGIGATAWMAHRAEQQRERADEERFRAERRFNDVRALAKAFIFDFNEQIANLAGSRPAREMLVRTALQYLQNLSAEAGDEDPGLQSELAAAWQQVGDIQGDPYQSNLGDTAGALKSYEQAYAIRKKLADAEPDNAARQASLAGALNQIGDIKQWMGDRTAAIETYQQAVQVVDRVLPANPDDDALLREMAASAMKMGDCLSWLQDQSKAREQYQRAMNLIQKLHDRDPDNVRDVLNLTVSHNKLAYMASDAGDYPLALQHLEAGLKLMLEQSRKDPNNAIVRRSISIGHNQIAATLMSMERFDDALTHLTDSLAIAQSLADADAGDVLAASDLAFTHNKVAELHYRQENVSKAIPHYRTALEIRQGLVRKDPNNASFQRDLAVSYSMVATAFQTLGKDETRTKEQRVADLREAVGHFTTCFEVFTSMQQRGVLAERDAGLPAETEAEIKACSEVLTALGASASE